MRDQTAILSLDEVNNRSPDNRFFGVLREVMDGAGGEYDAQIGVKLQKEIGICKGKGKQPLTFGKIGLMGSGY